MRGEGSGRVQVGLSIFLVRRFQKCWCEDKGWDMRNFWWSSIVYNPHRTPVCPWGRPGGESDKMTAGMLSHHLSMIV